MSCAICEKRKEKRFCPAVHGRICPQCCGEQREVTLDCPSDCVYLQQAREHEKPRPMAELDRTALFLQIEIGDQFLYEHEHLIMGLTYALAKSARGDRTLKDADLIAGLTVITKSYETLANSGLHYEIPIASMSQQAVVADVQTMIKEYREAEQKHLGYTRLRDSDVLRTLVFVLRMAHGRTSGRPKSRAFVDFLFGQFPDKESAVLAPQEARSMIRGEEFSIRLTGCPGGKASRSSRTVRLNTGCLTSGAISINGSSTNRRWCISGWGTTRSFVSMIEFPKNRISISMMRGPFFSRRRRPICRSRSRIPESSCFGIFSVLSLTAQFRNQG